MTVAKMSMRRGRCVFPGDCHFSAHDAGLSIHTVEAVFVETQEGVFMAMVGAFAGFR